VSLRAHFVSNYYVAFSRLPIGRSSCGLGNYPMNYAEARSSHRSPTRAFRKFNRVWYSLKRPNPLPNWKELVEEVKAAGSTHDVVRRKYLQQFHEHTGRNVIIYSVWLQKSDLQRQGIGGFSISDADKNGFMTAIHGMDRNKGLDLILHTPGGDAAATESLVGYLRAMFDTNIRAIVPQIAMSAGTMIACVCREILMGKHSSLGPIDPQIGGLAAHGVIGEFTMLRKKSPAITRLESCGSPS
jgi:Serine dehydrogenase proteinase